MMIHIAFPLADLPTGGGNQFLRALRDYLREIKVYSESLHEADIIIANGHQWRIYLYALFRAKRNNRKATIIHRVDGPMAVVRGGGDSKLVDRSIALFNNIFADGTIFQSNWSKDACIKAGMNRTKPSIIIHNAADPRIFYSRPNVYLKEKKIKIISTSWSSNWLKGFDILHYLDENLDFNKYEVTFIGNSPIGFTNIRTMAPLRSIELAEHLRKNSIFLAASHVEACSNSLIEAMSCGLIAVARNNSSFPEVVGDAGVLFNGVGDVISAIELVATDLPKYVGRQPQKLNMTHVGEQYLYFATAVRECRLSVPTWSDFFRLKVEAFICQRIAFFILNKLYLMRKTIVSTKWRYGDKD